MTLRDERPIHRCAIPGCVFIGRWDEGEACPMHRDTEPPRRPTLSELWEVTDDIDEIGRG